MATWETWFRSQSIDEVRKSLSLLDTQISNEKHQLHKGIGERYSDVLFVAERLESLNLLGKTLEHRVEVFASPDVSPYTDNNVISYQQKTMSSAHFRRKFEKRVAALAQRSIANRNYATAARALYFLEKTGAAQTKELLAVSKKLDEILDTWIRSGSFVSQSMYSASLIHLRTSPSKFLKRVLDERLVQISEMLQSPNTIPNAFKAVDSAVFIYNQAVSNWGNTRLSQRRVVDMAEFSSLLSLSNVLPTQMETLAGVKEYPTECYEQDGILGVEDFLGEVSSLITKLTTPSLQKVDTSSALVAILKEVIFQVENSLSSADADLVTLLNSFLPAFSARLEEIVDGVTTENWLANTAELRSSLGRLSKVSKDAKSIAPKLEESLLEIETKVNTKLESHAKQLYAAQWSAASEVSEQVMTGRDQFENCARQIKVCSDLNSAFKSLGGSPEPIPEAIFREFARGLVQKWEASEKLAADDTAADKENNDEPHQKPFRFHGNKAITILFELQLKLDTVLQNYEWEKDDLLVFRRSLNKAFQQQPELPHEVSEELQQLLVELDDHTAKRSSLLLKPLIAY